MHIDLNFILPLFKIKSFDEGGEGGELKALFCQVGLRWRFCFVKGTGICFKKTFVEHEHKRECYLNS